jgi:GntR family transcriptional regulator/MocR family aminotransferase
MGLSVSNGQGYFQNNQHSGQFVRLGFASLSPKELKSAVDIFARATKKSFNS